MLPTTEIELTDETAASPKKQKGKASVAAQEAAAVAKKQASLAYKESKRLWRETSFTPAALRPADRTVIF